MTIFCLKNVDPDPDPQINADPAQKRSIFSENGPLLSRIRIQMGIRMRIRIHKINADPDPDTKPQIRKKKFGSGRIRLRLRNPGSYNQCSLIQPVNGGY